MRKTAALASDLFVISDIQKRDYEKIFSMECKVITKGADFSKREENLVLHNNPLKNFVRRKPCFGSCGNNFEYYKGT